MARIISGQELVALILWVSSMFWRPTSASYPFHTCCTDILVHWEAFYLDDTHAL